MSTNDEPLRNPQVDYERADLSARGILLFLVGLFIAGVFIELVIWGMFRFLAHTEQIWPQGQVSSKLNPQRAMAEENRPGIDLQNTPAVNINVFPQPRLQTNDAGDMQQYLESEHNVLYPSQPFQDSTGAIHIPITLAMKLIEERGLPVRPNAPQHFVASQTGAGNPDLLHEIPEPLPSQGPGSPAPQRGQETKPPRAP